MQVLKISPSRGAMTFTRLSFASLADNAVSNLAVPIHCSMGNGPVIACTRAHCLPIPHKSFGSVPCELVWQDPFPVLRTHSPNASGVGRLVQHSDGEPQSGGIPIAWGEPTSDSEAGVAPGKQAQTELPAASWRRRRQFAAGIIGFVARPGAANCSF
jgi:hypothetical protein